MHLMLEGVCKNQRLLTDKAALHEWLLGIVSEVGMRVVDGPYIHEFEAPEGKHKGLTGIVVLAESHVSVHTFPEIDYAFIDLFSCFWFDGHAASRSIRQRFQMEPGNNELLIDRQLRR